MASSAFRLFERFGVELEYMIVDAATLDVRPVADRIIQSVGAARKNEIRHGRTRWSNELVLHVIELKTDGPAPALEGLAADFQSEVRFLNSRLGESGCRLLPSAMHPWMDPARETRLWPHGDRAIYEAFDRIFGCAGHGWSNVQSTHINLPFSGDDEFHRLHTAIRLVLPLLPALAASSPFQEGARAPKLDMRLEHYRGNCARIPFITGHIIPERVRSRAEYETEILARIRRNLAPHDPAGILEAEWVNARGAIARFERGTIEIRLLDIQEHPGADLAVVQFIVAVLRALVAEKLSPLADQRAPVVSDLADILSGTVAKAEDALLHSPLYLDALGLTAERPATAGDALRALLRKTAGPGTPWRSTVEFILRRGCLARRLRRAAGPVPDKNRLHAVYTELAECLQSGVFFDH